MLTMNGHSALHASVYLPRNGVWQADLRVDTVEDIVGAVVLDVDDGRLILKGTVVQGGLWQDTGSFRVLGGAGGLRLIAKPKHYTFASLRVILSDLLAGAGERLSSSSDAEVLRRSVPAWTTAALPTGRLITQLLASTGAASWRVLPDGTVWVGQETWPDSGLTAGDFQVLAEDPARAQALLGVDVPVLMPGTMLGDRRVSYVEHRFGQPETRISVWFEGGDDGADRMTTAIRRVVRAAQAPIDYLAMYVADVVSQAGGTIDVRPTDPRIPSMAAVPLFGGLPQWKLQINPGGRVLVGWSGGDPSQPYALAFNADVTTQVVRLLASDVAIGDEGAAQPTMLGATYRAQEATANGALADALTTLAGACTGPLSPLASGFTTMAGVLATFEGGASTYLTQNVRVS